jgi:hypothetical protein
VLDAMKAPNINRLDASVLSERPGKALLLVIWILLLSSCQSMPETDRSSMAMGFTEAVYGVGIEFSGQHPVARLQNMIRWDSDQAVQLLIVGETAGSDLYMSIVSDLTKLYRFASVDLKIDIRSSKQLLRVSVKDEPLLVTKDIKTTCYTDYDRIMDGYLETVDIVVARSAITESAESCLLHEGMHSLGFSGHPHRLNSVLSYTQGLVELSEIDKQLISMLYSKDLKQAVRLGDALTIAYSQFDGFSERKGKRQSPVDMSLELSEDESPVVLAAPFMDDASKQFFYETDKSGGSSLQSSYGARGSGSRFANIFYTRLSGNLIFKKQLGLLDYVKRYESHLGSIRPEFEGHFDSRIGRYKYIVASTSEFSCVFTIKYIDASDIDLGGHKVINGSYCGSASSAMQASDAELFIGAIRIYERDPIAIRERKLSSRKNAGRNFSAIRLTGRWPLDDSPVSGMKLFVQGRTYGNMKITINDEICDARLTSIQSSGLGTWTLDCLVNESASGRFSWDSDGSLSFRGQTSVSRSEIDWIAYQVF